MGIPGNDGAKGPDEAPPGPMTRSDVPVGCPLGRTFFARAPGSTRPEPLALP